MNKWAFHLFNVVFLLTALVWNSHAALASPVTDLNQLPTAKPTQAQPLLTPKPPTLRAEAYLLIDPHSGKILAHKNINQRRAPASLTKMMTLYVVSEAVRTGRIQLDDKVHISKKAWKTGGSRMFVKVGQDVSVRDLIKGIIVDSGNDACVALAEYVAGSENSFADLMNQQAKALGMTESHFVDSTGLPDPNHYTTARDMALLGRALVLNFPDYYAWYKQKWFTFNGIRQPNRNRLLWRDPSVDGIKTGHTNEAGYCLVSSAKEQNMRLLAVIMGAPSDEARASDSQRLLRYGFRFYTTHKLYSAATPLEHPRVWFGVEKTIPAGLPRDLIVTIPKGQYAHLKARLVMKNTLTAPITKGAVIGKVHVMFNGQTLMKRPLIALTENQKAGIFSRAMDSIRLTLHSWFNQSQTTQEGAA